MEKFFDLQRFAFNEIYIGTGISNTLVSGTGGADSIRSCWQSLNLNHYGSENNEI